MLLRKHSKLLWVLSFGKLWDTFSYFGTQTILALYFIHVFHLAISTSYLLYGAYAALAFSSPILGGIIADRWVGSKQALIAGCIFNIVGNLVMISLHRYLFCLGLSLSLLGSGLYKSTSTNLVGLLYEKSDTKKESGFTYFYLSMNVGGMLAPIIYGFVAYNFGWHYAFLCSALGIMLGGMWFVKNWNLLASESHMTKISLSNLGLLYAGLVLSGFLLSIPFYYPVMMNSVICLIFLFSMIYLLISIARYYGKHKKRLFALLMLCFIGMFYFAAGLQTGTTVTLYIQYKIKEGVIQTHLPGSTFNTLYCLFVVLFAPCVTYLWSSLKRKNIYLSAPAKIVMGIALAVLGMVTFAVSATTSFVLVSISIGYLFLSVGELVLTPAAYTAISDYSPVGMKNTMMGCWLLFIAMGGYFSSLLANFSHYLTQKAFNQTDSFFDQFMLIAVFTLFICIIASVLIPRIRRWMV